MCASEFARDCACHSRGRRGKVDIAVLSAHSTDKVAVGGGDGDLSASKYAHVSAEAWSASWGGHDCSALDKGLDIACLEGLEIYLVGARNNYRSYALGYLTSFEHFSRRLEVAESTVGARADDDLINLDPSTNLVLEGR